MHKWFWVFFCKTNGRFRPNNSGPQHCSKYKKIKVGEEKIRWASQFARILNKSIKTKASKTKEYISLKKRQRPLNFVIFSSVPVRWQNMLISTGSQKVCKNVERTILQTGRNSPSRINSYGNVSRSNFYNDKISIYSFIFAKYETGRNRSRLSVSLSFDHFAKLTKYKNTNKYFQVVPRNWKNIKIWQNMFRFASRN